MALGTAVAAGWVVPGRISDEYRLILGIVVFLYGAYRFAVAWYRRPGERPGPLP